jgi:hypothetical protein
LEVNDLGFQSITDYRSISTLIGQQDYTAGAHFSNWTAFVYENDTWNFGNRPTYRGYAGSANATLLNLWSANIGTGFSPLYYDERLLRGGPEGAQPASWYLKGGVGALGTRGHHDPQAALTSAAGAAPPPDSRTGRAS